MSNFLNKSLAVQTKKKAEANKKKRKIENPPDTQNNQMRKNSKA